MSARPESPLHDSSLQPGAHADAVAPVLQLLARSTRRLHWIVVLYGAAIGCVVSLPLMTTAAFFDWPTAAAFAASALPGIIGGALGMWWIRLRAVRTAVLIEQRAPDCRNLIITAAEIAQHPERVSREIRELVSGEAARVATRLDPATLFPVRRAALAFATTASFCALVVALDTTSPEVLPALVGVSAPAATLTEIEVIVTPPSYAGQHTDTLHDPARIDVLTGSRITVLARASTEHVSIETITRSDTVTSDRGRFTVAVTVEADGFIALAPVTDDGRIGARRLIGITVRNDRPPRVRVTAPGRDLFTATAPANLPVRIEADDDLGLASLSLRFTKVTGSGEQFTFTDGETPLEITRINARTWSARGILALDTLKLAAGDMIVYRAVARDRKPGSPATESDSYIVEVTGPGALAAGGFTIDDERDRYAVSQQMLIVFTQRLIARRDSLTELEFQEESHRLAAVQRQVRAEFVFMMGGELADVNGENAGIMELDEHAEAEAEDDVLSGRLANRGRLELVRAIRWMSTAAAALTATDLGTALTHEKNALEYLQRAFSRNRYILRTLTERERLDLARRLTGALGDAGSSRRSSNQPVEDARTVALRRVVAGIADVAGRITDRNAATEVTTLAETLLRIDAGSEGTVYIATLLNSAAEALRRSDASGARVQLEQATLQLAAMLRNQIPSAPPASPSLESRLLDGALIDALRRAGVR